MADTKQVIINSIKFNLSLGGLNKTQIDGFNNTIKEMELPMDVIVYSKYINS